MDPNMQYIFTAPDGFVCDLTLHVCQNDVDLNAFRQNVFYSVLQLGPFQVKRCEQSRDIIDFDGETNGRICIIDFGVRSDIEAICDLAIKRGARAFIAKNPPKTDMLVPIFLVPINTLEKMAFRPGALVNIQQKQTGSVKCDSVTVVHNGSSCVGKTMDGSESFPIDRLCTNESHPLVDESGGDIDLYYLSNLTPAGCGLSVPRYAVSLFSVNYETKRLISKTWELDAACCCRHALVSEEKFKVVWISEVTRKKKNVKYIKENVKGCVCVCNFTDARIVGKVLDEAVHGKAVALCSATKPLTETNFPVFVVDDTFLDFIFYVESSEVMFDLRDLPVAKLDTDRDVPEVNHFSVHPSFPCSPVAMQPNFTEKTREETGKVQVGNSGEESNVDKCLKSKQHSSIDMIGTEPKYGLRNSMKNAGKELGNIWKELGNKGKAALNKLLFSTGPFLVHFDDFYKCYIQAFEKIESLDVEQAVRQGKEFMKAKTYKICLSHFAALAYLCTKSQSETLVHELLRCLRQYEPSNQDALFLTMPKTKDSVASFEIPQKVLYNFFIRNIDSWTKNHEAVGSGFNKEVWKCVVLLSLSGLVRKQVVSDMQLLRQAINPTILADYRKRFYSALDKDTMMTLTLCFQKDFFGYIHALKSQTQSRPICLNKMKFDMLLHFIEDQLQKDISCATLLWKNLSELSDKIHLEKGSARKLINIFLINIGLKSFQAVNVLYDLIVTAVNCNVIVDCDVIASDIETFLIKTIFESKNFDIEYVSHFYLLPISKFVRSIMHYDALTNYAVNAMTSESTFAKKLILIDLTYMQGRTCMGMSMNTKTELLLIECFKMLMSHGKSRFHLLCEIIQNAVSMPDLSLFSAEEHTMKEIASSTIRGCLPEIISRPRILRDIPDIIVEAQTFVEMIVELLQIGLQHHFKSVAEATKFYIEIFDSSCSTYSPLALHISQGVFHHALVKWEPHSVVDITEEHKLTMDVIFSESMPRNEITNKHHILIKKLVQTWTSSFLQGKVTSNQILRVIDSLDGKIWNTFETSTESSLPSTVVLQSTLDEVYEIEVVVRDMLTVCVDGEQFSLSHLLMEYCCDPPNDISRIMETYADDAAALSMMKTIEDFRNDHKFILLLIYEYGEIFDLCAYFLRHNSLLFRDAVYPKRGTSHTVATLARFVQDACKRIQSTIGPEMHYHGVVDAMKVLNTIDSVNSEIIVLKNSKLLITQTDTANFEIVALLCDLAVPLRQFVQCCDNFKFTVAADESLFAELKREVQQFYMADHNPIHICLRFFDQVLCFLCMNSTNSPFDKIEQLQATVPWITLLSDLSLHPELWNYVAEMKWFGDDGLKRFYDEYNNVTNVLLGNTQSYEMSVLTSLEPIVRIVSIVGKFKSSKTIFELFCSFDSNKDIRLAVREGTIAIHIHQIHARLSEIKDWFGNGVNEVAASSAIFTKAMNCGKFTVVNDNSKHYLALVINEKHEKIVKSGADLDYFVSQLSLIQNESDVISSSMEGFIEQFQVLKAAYRNFITMDMVGFSSISTSDFVCRPGLDFLDEAKVLHRVTEEHLETFKTWLSQTRWRYKISMLFWTEELRDLNKVLTSTNDNVMLVAQYFLSRLCPLWKKVLNVSHPAHLQFIVENIEHFHNNRSTSWLENVSRFIDACHVECANTTETLRGTGTSEIVLHSICCTTEDEKLCFFLVLGHIYKDRLPYVYEILDGSVPCSEDRFSLFLDRVKAFPTLKFTIVNAEKLHSKNLEALLLFLSDRRVESMCIRFYCIQRGDSLIHTSPWIEGKSWSLESLLPSSSCWNTAIEKYASVLVVASQNCSSGKTHFIRTKLKELESSVQSATLTIHEMSSVSTLVQALNLKFCNSRQTRALHVSLLYLPTGVSNERWLAEINHFFFSLIVLRHVYDPHLASSCSMSEKFCLFIEMPISTDAAHVWLKKNIPIVASCAEFPDIRIPFDVDQKARRVCTYLRAYDTGTIDRRYEGAANKRIVLVLDTSGSMEGSKFVSAIKNAISIFDSHIVEGDKFGVTLFDSSTYHVIPIQEVVGSNIEMMRQSLLNLTLYGGGTEMYSALAHTFTSLLHLNSTIDSWVVCLTDGESGMEDYGLLRELVAQSPENQHIVVVGIALSTQYEEAILYMCQRFSAGNVTAKGFFVRADSATSGIDEAFDVVKSKIPVSQTFDRDGAMSDDECRQYMAKYLPEFIDDDDMIAMSFWIRFLYRRVTVFDNNESFNYNETSENLGSSLMTIMLIEVERLLSENQQRDWQSESYIQLIYDFTSPKKPEFRLVCTAPNDIDPNLKEKLLSFHLPGFHIPTKQDLENRSSLDLFLSTAIGVPRHENEDGLLKIKCIDDHGFVLTLDFTMKLLSIHERIACQVPCVIEGETGVSKTALTKMYAILRNHGMTMNAQQKTADDLIEIEHQVTDEGFTLPDGFTSFERLDRAMDLDLQLAKRILVLIREKVKGRSPIFVDLPLLEEMDETSNGRQYLESFRKSTLEKSFFEINVDASLTEGDFIIMFDEVTTVATKIVDTDATVVVFLDEINTSTVLGLLKEIIIDRSISGKMLMDNIVIVGACNPPRTQIQTFSREQDKCKTWASGHYQVSELPPSLKKMKWAFGALSHSQEKEFIYRRMEMIHGDSVQRNVLLRATLTEIVCTSHEMIRKFAKENITQSLCRNRMDSDVDKCRKDSDVEKEAIERARSVVSLRDIQRVFALYTFFVNDMNEILFGDNVERSGILLSVAIVYYLRLDTNSREKFVEVIDDLPTECNENFKLLNILRKGMDAIVAATDVPVGIAMTRGLQENIFATSICSLSQTPLIIVGPPGASKTLAVQIVGDNACGSDSKSSFYSKRPRLSLFHYQCSKTSTSKEIAAVFDKAFQRQENVDSSKNRCVVFMDEAGLPEEDKESLKVLHYLLEGHMSAKSKVGFVAISNHILDAAKSNRCIMLLRQDPDKEEMFATAVGVLFEYRQDGHSCTYDVQINDKIVSAQQFATSLCLSYTSLFAIDNAAHLNTFYGLRDFIYLLKAIRSLSQVKLTRLVTTMTTILCAIERNFNGVMEDELYQVTECFIKPLMTLVAMKPDMLNSVIRYPLTVLKEALQPVTCKNCLLRPRFKLIIDCTDDDSILRLLRKSGIVETSRRSLHKLSNLPDDVEFERIRLVSRVKFAAMQGNFAVLSQTEPVNESFYDLFNQRFNEITKQDGKVTMFANIAVGGVSRRSLVLPTFECIVHVRESNLLKIPAPFLNRFEKYRLTLKDVFVTNWSTFQRFSDVVEASKRRVDKILSTFKTGSDSLRWVTDSNTLESIFIDMLPDQDDIARKYSKPEEGFGALSLDINAIVTMLLEKFTSLSGCASHVDECIKLARCFFPAHIITPHDNILNKSNELRSLVNFFSTSTSDEKSTIQCFVSGILQMAITRVAIFRIIQLCTPEIIYLNRETIPSDLVQEYFNQQHFSLKQLLSSFTSGINSEVALMIVHTRSDHIIHAIPCLPADRVSEATNDTNVIRKMIYENSDNVVVEHLHRLRSERTVRASILEWLSHETRSNYIMFVDMSHISAIDQVNYIRMQVEQSIFEKRMTRKSFSLVLHYPPSSSSKTQYYPAAIHNPPSSSMKTHYYPALFLGGWDHMFLDSIGNSSMIDINYYISHACINNESNVKCKEKCVHILLTATLPRALPYLVSQSLFYRDQSLFRSGSFTERKMVLTRLFAAKIDSSTFGRIACEKFVEMWFDHILVGVIRRSSLSLVNGTTQVSLTMSIHSAMVHIFQSYMSDILVQANQWKNLDLLSCSLSSSVTSRNLHCCELFELVLRELPTRPIDELILQRQRMATNRLVPLPIKLPHSSEDRFPFFYLISSYLDELVENVIEIMACQQRHFTSSLFAPSANDVLQKATIDINDENDKYPKNQEKYDRRKLALIAVNFVRQHPIVTKDTTESLFKLYIRQYIEWKIGCASCSVFQQWWTICLRDINDIAVNNLVAVHVIARVYQADIIKIASGVELLGSISEFWDINQADGALNCRELSEVLFQAIEHQLKSNPSRLASVSVQWPLMLSSAYNKTKRSEGNENENMELTGSLRRIGLLSLNAYDQKSKKQNDNTIERKNSSVLIVQHENKETTGFDFTNLATASQLELFLSPMWVRVSQVFLPTDVKQLLDAIDSGIIFGSPAVGLLKSASSGSIGATESLFHGYSINLLLQANERLHHASPTQFTEKGERCCLPHYIPEWLQTTVTTIHVNASTSTQNYVYFAEYHNSITGKVAIVLFELFLSIFSDEAATETSTQLFLILLKEIDAETKVTRQMNTQLSRLRGMGIATSLQGSLAAMIAIEARIACFVAKVASEIAINARSSILECVYAAEAISFIDKLMGNIDVAKWQEFFIATILRIRGEGSLSSVLKGPLTCFTWCDVWAEGIPNCGSDLVDMLQQAEIALISAKADEEWKTRNQRFCPHCGQVFEVAAINCGRFRCGRDFHLNNGRAVVDGMDAERAGGCSREFQLNTSIPYQADESKIAPKRDIVNEIRKRIQSFEQSSSMWTQARALSIPPLVLVEKKSLLDDTIYPSVELLSQEGVNSNEIKCIECLRVLWEYSTFASLVLLLPDLIELYVWLHETLRFLLTKDVAYSLSIYDVMKKEALQIRFDAARVNHLSELWDRASVGFDSFLKTNKHVVNYECEDVTIPFEKLQNAKLICLLSEGSHSTENDFLFLVIQNIVSLYNSFSEKLSTFCKIDSGIVPKRNLLSPRHIIRGFGGAIRIGSVAPLPIHSLIWLAECSWDSHSDTFDLEKVELLLNNLVNLSDTPSWILNPIDHLREKFCFRNESSQPIGAPNTENIVNVDQRGNFYGNFQDFELFETAYELLSLLNMLKGDVLIQRTIMDVFRCIHYENIRSLLEGCRNIMEELLENGNEICFTSLDALLLVIDSSKSQVSSTAQMQEFGFPELETKQIQLILSLNVKQFVELIWYCGYQLASEAHLFSNLPSYVGDPLTDQMKHELDINLSLLSKEQCAKVLANTIDEFISDVLGYYEFQIVDEASKSDSSLKTYLMSQNFSDSSDPIFAAIPASVLLRNYISLRQTLQQVKLSYLYRTHQGTESVLSPQGRGKNSSMSCTSGYCWLWDDVRCLDGHDDEHNIVRDSSTSGEKKFWFEKDLDSEVYSVDEGIEIDILSSESQVLAPIHDRDTGSCIEETSSFTATNEDVATDTCNREYLKVSQAAVVLQHWWRRKYELRKGSYVTMYDYFDADEDDGTDSDAESQSNYVSRRSVSVSDDMQFNIETMATVESRYSMEMDLSENAHPVHVTDGTSDDETHMRHWMDAQRLPQTMADTFVAFGVRTIDDVCLLLSEEGDGETKQFLSGFAPLDRHKLRKGITALSSLLSETETSDSTLNWSEEME